jgi:signal transduction histidine kinase
VEHLHQLLVKNKELDERVRRAAAETTALNEQVLRRISAELHDGPAQDLGLALLKLDNVIALSEARSERDDFELQDLSAVKQSINHALQETRAISSGMGVPQLNDLTLSEIVTRIVRTHERRTATKVAVEMQGLPTQASLPVKITLYRVIQESLNNAFRHAHGMGQCVHVTAPCHILEIRVSDGGPGMNGNPHDTGAEKLGIIGMRDRVETLGGTFEWTSNASGTRVCARLPLASSDERENSHCHH